VRGAGRVLLVLAIALVASVGVYVLVPFEVRPQRPIHCSAALFEAVRSDEVVAERTITVYVPTIPTTTTTTFLRTTTTAPRVPRTTRPLSAWEILGERPVRQTLPATRREPPCRDEARRRLTGAAAVLGVGLAALGAVWLVVRPAGGSPPSARSDPDEGSRGQLMGMEPSHVDLAQVREQNPSPVEPGLSDDGMLHTAEARERREERSRARPWLIGGAVLGFLMWVPFAGRSPEEAEADAPDLYPLVPDLGLVLLVACLIALGIQALRHRQR